MISSVYGKRTKNLRKRINIRLVNNKKDFFKYISRPSLITHRIFNKKYAAIHEIKPVLTLNKPIYVIESLSFLGPTMWDLRHVK